MKKADFVTEITVTDPDTQAPVHVAIYKDRESNGMFGVDSAYILTLSDDDPVVEPFNGGKVMLVETDERDGLMFGERDAREEMEDDDELCLYTVEVGMFDLEDDPHTAYDTVEVMVACYAPQQAAETAVVYCEENMPVVRTINFGAMDNGVKVGE